MGATESAHPASAGFCCEDDEGNFDCCDLTNNRRAAKLRQQCCPGKDGVDVHETLLGKTLQCGFADSLHQTEEEAEAALYRYREKLILILDPNDSGFITGGELVEICERLDMLGESRMAQAGKELRSQITGEVPVPEALQLMDLWMRRCGFVDATARVEALRTVASEWAQKTLGDLIEKLFLIQDLNDDGFLEERELVQLNKKLAMLHYGKGVDKASIEERYRALFRTKLDSSGAPVALTRYSEHVLEELRGLDADPIAQIAILEQWLMEATFARNTFRDPSFQSLGDVPILLLDGFRKLNEASTSEVKSTTNDETTTQASSPRLLSPRAPPRQTRVPYPSEQGSSISSVGEMLDAFNLSFLTASRTSSKSGL